MDFIKKYTSHEEYEVDKTPNVSLCVENNEKHLHYTKKNFDDEYLTFEALESGTFTLTIGSAVTTGDVTSVSYSLDNGETWTTTNNVQGEQVVITTPTVNAGDEVLWKGNAVRMANRYDVTNNASVFSSTCKYNIRGNVMSLLYNDDFENEIGLSGKDYSFSYLFYNSTKLKNSKELLLPATTLAPGCYYYMFYNCTSMVTTPELPATTLAVSCYNGMFANCTRLTTAPELPATVLGNSCYSFMFRGCTSLTVAPELPATTMADYCYNYMFYGCTSLTVAPELPATTLANVCYESMFYNCIRLVVAPELPATTLAYACYNTMFTGCARLAIAPELPATTLTERCYYNMFGACTSLTIAPELPATTLANGCYSNMFYNCKKLVVAPTSIGDSSTTIAESACTSMFSGCQSLTIAPELPATALTKICYSSMFEGCKSLKKAPSILPATILAQECYTAMFRECTNLTFPPASIGNSSTIMAEHACDFMFYACTNLKTAPELPATTLAEYCYYRMFLSCANLVTAPSILPATTLANYCYADMFQYCTRLTIAPELPATTLVERCYYGMFEGCENLNFINCMAETNINVSGSTENWVNGVSNSGTFIGSTGATWSYGVNGVPIGWTSNTQFDKVPILRMWIDDFVDNYDFTEMSERAEDWGYSDVEEYVSAIIESGDKLGGNPYVYYGDTFEYNGNTYYLWEYDGEQYIVPYLLTDTVDYDTLFDMSLEADVDNEVCPYVTKLNSDSEETYSCGDTNDWLITVEQF